MLIKFFHAHPCLNDMEMMLDVGDLMIQSNFKRKRPVKPLESHGFVQINGYPCAFQV